MITIQSYIVDPKILMKILFHYPLELPFIPSNPKILKVFPKIFPTEMKPGKCPTKKKTTRKTQHSDIIALLRHFAKR